MLKIRNIKLPIGYTKEDIKGSVAKKLKIDLKSIDNVKLARISIDARKKENIYYTAAVEVTLNTSESAILRKCKDAEPYSPYRYTFNPTKKLSQRPVIIGSGPAGLFAALTLARYGEKPIVIERGKDVDRRNDDVDRFFFTGELNESSNIQFGEGGAGTFSDGKLNTGTNDSRATHVLRTFVEHGAQEDILINAKPHIGTDVLKTVIKNIRKEIISLGGKFYFDTLLTDIKVIDRKVKAILIKTENGTECIDCDNLILAIGHSARDTFEMLLKKGVALEQKPFSMGVRIEHSAEEINTSQYGRFAKKLPTADYKLNIRDKTNRGVYTFCMCPGGYVVNASSEKDRLCTNGMSYSKRNAVNSNSAVLVSVNTTDFPSDSPISGIDLQRSIEEKAFIYGGSDYCAPVQTVGNLLSGKSNKIGNVTPTIKPGYNFTDFNKIFPEFILNGLKDGISAFGNRLDAFKSNDAILTAAETRSSSPVRIMRNERLESINISGLYPCGEGAGYAGGIVSAAVDGIKCAEMMMTK